MKSLAEFKKKLSIEKQVPAISISSYSAVAARPGPHRKIFAAKYFIKRWREA